MNSNKKEDHYKESSNKLSEQQVKYTYYIIALNISCIGFSVYHTMDEFLDKSLLWLGTAIVFWSISIFFGFKMLRESIKTAQKNVRAYHPASIPPLAPYTTHSKKFYLSEGLFFAGVLCFLFWRIIEMS